VVATSNNCIGEQKKQLSSERKTKLALLHRCSTYLKSASKLSNLITEKQQQRIIILLIKINNDYTQRKKKTKFKYSACAVQYKIIATRGLKLFYIRWWRHQYIKS